MADDALDGGGEPLSSETEPSLTARDDPDDPELMPDGAVSRLPPYLLTAGRAEPVDDTLEIETQVMSTEQGVSARLAFEQRDIVELCVRPMSVAEVAYRLTLHIGVTRVLVADLAALGYLVVQRPGAPFSQDLELIERVIRGLKAIR